MVADQWDQIFPEESELKTLREKVGQQLAVGAEETVTYLPKWRSTRKMIDQMSPLLRKKQITYPFPDGAQDTPNPGRENRVVTEHNWSPFELDTIRLL